MSEKLNITEYTEIHIDIPNKSPYIILIFNAGTPKNPIILRSEPIYGLKEIKKTMKIIDHNNLILGFNLGKRVEVEKHNFKDWKELPIDWNS